MKNKNKMVANDLPHNKYNCKYDNQSISLIML
jgi:hypothetical protein